ncbi:hypothetical protein EDB81DRAFT_856715 [Dactylonectria macrodidyma]|uniref:Uncharacterized protein n=1 Tax=Dactylonectria macrodidyma TaxID=307937 RepID=A0A9P9EVW2_9HYPO|nr:hypothetical protein EDB81DRAFT_856715 [Dactylonectria macrodidyma]
MRLLPQFPCGLMLALAATRMGTVAGATVDFTPTATHMHVNAIIPTTSGQIGVNPVSILPPASIFRGTVYDSDAPTATTITKDGKTETHKIFFAVATNAAGDLDISIVDPDLRSFLEDLADEVSSCAISKLRRLRRAIQQREAVCGHNEDFLEGARQKISPEAWRDAEEQIIEAAPDHPAIKAVLELNPEDGGTGSGDVPVGEPGADERIVLSLASEEELTLLEAGAGPATGILGVGLLSYIFHVFLADKSVAGAGEKVSITGVHIPSNSIQTLTETKTTSTKTTSTNTCPDPTQTELICTKDECDLDLPLEEDAKFVCKSGKYQDCPCAVDTEFVSAEVSNGEDQAMKFLGEALSSKPLTPPKFTNVGECSRPNESVETETWFNLIQKLCTDKKHYKLDKDFSVEYTHEDVFSSGSDEQLFEFYWKKTEGVDCKNICTQIFIDGFRSTSCMASISTQLLPSVSSFCSISYQKAGHYDSHTRAQSGSVKLGCGEAGYTIRNPESEISGPQCGDNDWSPLPSNVWNGQAGNVFSTFCNNVSRDKKLKMTIDPSGKAKPVQWRNTRRSPPPDPDLYDKYRIDFYWKPKEGSDIPECEMSCEEVMTSIGHSTCGHKGSGMRKMSTTASYDLRCGTYSYRIRDRKQPFALGEQKCYKPNQFGKHKDVGPPNVRSYSKAACKNVKGYRIIKGDEDSTLIHELTKGVSRTTLRQSGRTPVRWRGKI